MPNKKQKWNRENWISIVITALFILGFILIYTDSSNIIITGQTVQDTLLIEHVEISSAVDQGISRSDLILFGILPIIILALLFSIDSYGSMKLILKRTKIFIIIKNIVIFLIKHILSLIFVIIIMDFVSSKYLSLTNAALETITTLDIVYYAIIPISVISLIFILLIYLLMEYVE